MFLLAAVHSSQLMCIRSAIYIHYLVCRECLGPIIGGALVYRVGFRTMTAVRFIGIVVCDIKTSPKYFFLVFFACSVALEFSCHIVVVHPGHPRSLQLLLFQYLCIDQADVHTKLQQCYFNEHQKAMKYWQWQRPEKEAKTESVFSF